MKYNIYLLSFNNYNNRQVKGKALSSIQDFINGGYQVGQTIFNVNFEYKDGIMSKLIINQAFVDTQPDYVLIAERGEGGIENGNFSRWFIIDSDLVRGNQYEFIVKRDICIDYNDILMNSTYFVERGYVSNSNDLIFNNEGQQYSQIKKGQTPLYDETGVPWIVGYIPKKLSIDTNVEVKSYVRPEDADFVVTSIEQWDYWQYVISNPSHVSLYGDNVSDAYRFVVHLPVKTIYNQGTDYQLLYMGYTASGKGSYAGDVQDTKTIYPTQFTIQSTGLGYFSPSESGYNSYVSQYGWNNETHTNILAYRDTMNELISNQTFEGTAYNNMMTAFKAVYSINNDIVNYVENNLNGKTIKDLSTGKLYKIMLNDRIVDKLEGTASSQATAKEALKSAIRNFLTLQVGNAYRPTNYGYSIHTFSSAQNGQITPYFKFKVIQIELTEMATTRTYVPRDDDTSGQSPVVYRNHCVDQMYDIFAIPYGALSVKSGANTIVCNKDVGLSIAQQIATRFDQAVYDLQLLPYCPCREYIQSDGTFDITSISETKVRPIYYGDDSLTALNYVFYCSSSKLDNINLLHKVNGTFVPYSIEVRDIKKSYNTEMYRLSSPNFASSFEFRPAQNGGVQSFIVSATYKPYNPYIRVRPQFNRMLGQDFKDGRGLILQGDFSLATMTDRWQQYELQNKNYLNSFNREIASMNLQNKIAGTQDIWNAVSGSVTGAVAGAAAGGMAGGIPGAIVGGVAGAGLSVAGGVMDVQNNRKLRNDAIDKAKTLFNYSLDNIKALPYTIRNVGALTIDNVLVPVLEYYSASDDEIETFEKKMKYYGMSVMQVGTLIDYINPTEETFIQGYLLRLISPLGVLEEADNHLAEELSSEVQKGLYIGG